MILAAFFLNKTVNFLEAFLKTVYKNYSYFKHSCYLNH